MMFPGCVLSKPQNFKAALSFFLVFIGNLLWLDNQ